MSAVNVRTGQAAPGLLLAAACTGIGSAIGAARPSAGVGFAFLLAAVQGMLALASP